MNLAEVMHLCSLGMRTGRIEYRYQSETGFIYFENGTPLHATIHDRTGNAAVMEMLLNEGGEADFYPESFTGIPKTIDSPCEQLLLESARIIDESRELEPSGDGSSQKSTGAQGHRLIQISETEPKITLDINEDNLTLGRLDTNPLYVPHHTVSRRHCLFRIRGNKLFVTDLTSTNGTFVNNSFAQETRLRHGDTLQVGTLLFRYEITSLEPDTPATSSTQSIPKGELYKTAAIPLPVRHRHPLQ